MTRSYMESNDESREPAVPEFRAAVVGGGLAGCECALALARFGLRSTVFEMKPSCFSPAHKSQGLAELVCSNSFRSNEPESAVGRLKQEMRALGSVVMRAAEAARVPAGKALAVDRDLFSRIVTRAVEAEPLIELVRSEVSGLDDPGLQGYSHVVLSCGPLASDSLSRSLSEAVGSEHLYFYDAIAPIVSAESVDMTKAFWGSRYHPEEKDYLNCPMTKDEYLAFHQALIEAEKVPSREFEKELHFEGCMPVETLAERGEMTLAFGSLKPVGLVDPRTGEQPFAVLQLRPENKEKSSFNLVGCQTKLRYPEQERVFRLVPGLEGAEFLRLGGVHRNTFVNAPKVLTPELELKSRPGIYLAGQITGVEGYVESAACGLWLGLFLGCKARGGVAPPLPEEAALGGLLAHLGREVKNFQPSNVNFGLTPPLGARAPKRKRKIMLAERAEARFGEWLARFRESCPQGAD